MKVLICGDRNWEQQRAHSAGAYPVNLGSGVVDRIELNIIGAWSAGSIPKHDFSAVDNLRIVSEK